MESADDFCVTGEPYVAGILDHVRDGRMSLLDYAFHNVLCQLADPSTGIARTSASHLARELCINRKLAQKYLGRLERKRYIRRFGKARSHAPQTTLIHGYECVVKQSLDAWSSKSDGELVYVATDSRG